MSASFSLPEFPVPARLAIRLKPAAERMVRKQHPWVFDASITKQNKEGKAGDLAIVFDQKKNKFLALGLYDP
ncbi:MAG: class I SAM-dependent rRNA methyltransferase, partial [Bacteroidota bacterium]